MTVEMKLYASTVIWMSSFLLPYLLFVASNHFGRPVITLLRAAIAIGLGWLLTVAYAIAANAMTIATLNYSQQSINVVAGDGASLSFSVLFGWFLPLIVVCLAWIIHAWVLPRLKKEYVKNKN